MNKEEKCAGVEFPSEGHCVVSDFLARNDQLVLAPADFSYLLARAKESVNSVWVLACCQLARISKRRMTVGLLLDRERAS